jgi:hypothetical protein
MILSLLGDLASMQLEKSGNRPALDGGQLTDHFVYATTPEETHLTAVVMNPPSEGKLPRKSPDQFDISPRCLPLPEGRVVVWSELGPLGLWGWETRRSSLFSNASQESGSTSELVTRLVLL